MNKITLTLVLSLLLSPLAIAQTPPETAAVDAIAQLVEQRDDAKAAATQAATRATAAEQLLSEARAQIASKDSAIAVKDGIIKARDAEIARLLGQVPQDIKAGADIVAVTKATVGPKTLTVAPNTTWPQTITLNPGVVLKGDPTVKFTGRVFLNDKSGLDGVTVADRTTVLAANAGVVQVNGNHAFVVNCKFENIKGVAIGVLGDYANLDKLSFYRVSQPVRAGTADKTLNVGGRFTNSYVKEYNHDKAFDMSGPGISKSTRTFGWTVDRVKWERGFGPAWWNDIEHIGFTFTNNEGVGIQGITQFWQGTLLMCEISNSMEKLSYIANNRTTGCSWSLASIQESAGFLIENNHSTDSNIEVRNIRNGDGSIRSYNKAENGTKVECTLHDVTIRNNDVAGDVHFSSGVWPGGSKRPYTAEFSAFLGSQKLKFENNN